MSISLDCQVKVASALPEGVHVTLTPGSDRLGRQVVEISVVCDRPQVPPAVKLEWTVPAAEIDGRWTPLDTYHKVLTPNWVGGGDTGYVSRANYGAPVCCLFDYAGNNRLTFAVSEVLQPVKFNTWLHAENVAPRVVCSVELLAAQREPITSYRCTLLMDTRRSPYYSALADISRWWESLPGCTPARVPEAAKLPVYSTWYSLFRGAAADAIEQQCREAARMGCKAVIVDDGWQQDQDGVVYSLAGDWQPVASKIPDMKAHVARVHAMGMKYVLWYCVPLAGEETGLYRRFKDKCLLLHKDWHCGILDPRFPEVRSFLIETYASALREWDIDGVKLDFVDSFMPPSSTPVEYGNGRDFESVHDATDRLLTDIVTALQKIKPDVMVEFRQAYIGPLMRKYGNMFRASDCLSDPVTNRVRCVDLRLLCGSSAVHADMIRWHPAESTEHAALHVLNALFAVPQVSVRFEELPGEHKKMLQFWLEQWMTYRSILMEGELVALHPEMQYPVVLAKTADECVAAVYDKSVVQLGSQDLQRLVLVNATSSAGLALKWKPTGHYQLLIRNTVGETVSQAIFASQAGELALLPVPPAGLAELTRLS